MMDYSEIVKKIKPNIAQVVALNPNGQIFGSGSGFVFSKKGILVTCNHIIKDAHATVIRFQNGEYTGAKVVIKDEEHDLALLKFDDDKRTPLELCKDEEVKEGMPVIFAGYPLNLQDVTTHQGIISAVIKDATGITTYLIDGTVNSGNSGCPLMNAKGEVIGVVNAKRRERSDLLSKVEGMALGAVSLHGIDLVEIYHALINNVQLGIGYAVPASYIPEHKDLSFLDINTKSQINESNKALTDTQI